MLGRIVQFSAIAATIIAGVQLLVSMSDEPVAPIAKAQAEGTGNTCLNTGDGPMVCGDAHGPIIGGSSGGTSNTRPPDHSDKESILQLDAEECVPTGTDLAVRNNDSFVDCTSNIRFTFGAANIKAIRVTFNNTETRISAGKSLPIGYSNCKLRFANFVNLDSLKRARVSVGC